LPVLKLSFEPTFESVTTTGNKNTRKMYCPIFHDGIMGKNYWELPGKGQISGSPSLA